MYLFAKHNNLHFCKVFYSLHCIRINALFLLHTIELMVIETTFRELETKKIKKKTKHCLERHRDTDFSQQSTFSVAFELIMFFSKISRDFCSMTPGKSCMKQYVQLRFDTASKSLRFLQIPATAEHRLVSWNYYPWHKLVRNGVWGRWSRSASLPEMWIKRREVSG